MTENRTSGRVVILVIDPKTLSPEHLAKPVVLVARLPRFSQIISVTPMPNLLEVLGMGSGGGAPGFSVRVPRMSKEEPTQYEVNRFIAGFLPGSEIILPNALGLHIGTCTSAGVVMNYFEVVLDETSQTLPFEAMAKALEKEGFKALKLVEYETPPVLLSALRGAPVRLE